MTLRSNEKWTFPKKLDENVLKKYEGVSTVLAQLLHDRGVAPENANSFLKPSLADIPSHPKLFDSKRAAKQILKSIEDGERIYIHGDFDVDGVCATAILWEFLYKELPKKIGKRVDVLPYIPSRVDEGYGLSNASVDAMISDGAKLIITVDCGIRDSQLIEEYPDASFIVTDHHQPPDDIESAKHTIVHQMFPKKQYPFEKICGSAIAFLLVQAIKEEAGMDHTIAADTPGLDLVGLATVTDMMPLSGVNRVFVKYGLEQMRSGSRLGLKSLCKVSAVNPEDLDSYHLGFVIGPKINAAGRIGDAMDAVRLLVSEDIEQTSALSAKLYNLNSLRQEKTENIISLALKEVDQMATDMLLFISGKGWEEGIIGLVAGKIFEKFKRPVIVVTENNGEMRGSARSTSSFNITEALEQHSEFLLKYGGHAQAAGFNVKEGELENLKKKLVKFANENITPDMLSNELEIDLQLDISEITTTLYEEIQLLKPFGYGNKAPLIAFNDVTIKDIFEMSGGQHAKITIEDSSRKSIEAVLFNCAEDIPEFLPGNRISLAGTIDMNEWNGKKKLQIYVKSWK